MNHKEREEQKERNWFSLPDVRSRPFAFFAVQVPTSEEKSSGVSDMICT
jgi:hypothetical protein